MPKPFATKGCRAVAGAGFVVIAAGVLPAQTLDDLRAQVRDSVGIARQAAFLAGVIDLAESPQLAAGSLTITPGTDLDVDTWKLPWMDRFAIAGTSTEVRVEAGLGYVVGRSSLADLWSGTLQGGETEVHTRWEGLSGYLGAGPAFALAPDLRLSPIVDVSLSYLENRTRYGGPGADFTAALFDGILFNWHATSYAVGAAAVLEHEVHLAADTSLSSLVRYDVRWFDGIRSTDPAQDVEDDLQRITLRTEFAAPTGLRLFDGPLRWNSHVGYARFLGLPTSVLGFLDYFEIGAGLETVVPVGGTPFRTMRLSGALLVGEDVHGWSLGMSVAF